MAVVYYPKDQLLYSKDTSQGNYEALVLSSTPNVVLYFGTASVPTSASALDLPITCSWAKSASISLTYITTATASYVLNAISSSYSSTSSFASSAISSSYSSTSSFALNGGTGGSAYSTASGYTTLITNSNYGITCSFMDTEEYVTVAVGATYYFTSSNPPTTLSASNVSLYIKNIAAATSSLSFPSAWTFIGIVPTYLTSSKSAILSLKAFGPEIVAAWGSQY